jgi:hypothetical protein
MRILITVACGHFQSRDAILAFEQTDEPRFVRGIEALYLQMWARWCEGPEHV